MNETNASRGWIKRVNRNLVLNLIKSGGPISRKDVARRSGLSPATVSNLTGELLAEGLILEVGAGESTRGRPPVLLEINSKAGFVVGVKLMAGSAALVVTDLDADVLFHATGQLPDSGDDPAPVIDAVAALVEAAISASGVRKAQVLGVGVGLAGLIDGQAGVCRYSPVFGWRNVDLVNPLGARLELEVCLENDVNTLTIAEQWFGHGHGHDDFVVLTVGSGIGLGMVVNGQFYRGLGGSAGELGHITVDASGPECGCGKRGCLEALASDRAVLDQIRRAIAIGESTILGSEELTIDRVMEAANDGDALAREMLAASGRWLGIGAATVINLVGPELLIIGGEGVKVGDWRLQPMLEALDQHSFDDLASRTKIVVEPGGDETWARGAACVVLGELFRSPIHDRGRASRFEDPPNRTSS